MRSNRRRRSTSHPCLPATLQRLAGGWFLAYPGLPIIASGMIGSRHGWREAPYVRCPAEPRDIAANLTPVGTDEREFISRRVSHTRTKAGSPM